MPLPLCIDARSATSADVQAAEARGPRPPGRAVRRHGAAVKQADERIAPALRAVVESTSGSTTSVLPCAGACPGPERRQAPPVSARPPEPGSDATSEVTSEDAGHTVTPPSPARAAAGSRGSGLSMQHERRRRARPR